MNEHRNCTCPASKSGSFQIATDHYSRNFIPTGWKLEYTSLEQHEPQRFLYTQRTRTESCELSVRVTLPPKASRRESPDLPHSPSRLDLSLKSDYTNNKYRT